MEVGKDVRDGVCVSLVEFQLIHGLRPSRTAQTVSMWLSCNFVRDSLSCTHTCIPNEHPHEDTHKEKRTFWKSHRTCSTREVGVEDQVGNGQLDDYSFATTVCSSFYWENVMTVIWMSSVTRLFLRSKRQPFCNVTIMLNRWDGYRRFTAQSAGWVSCSFMS